MVVSSSVTGTMQDLPTAMGNLSTITLAFATGECGAETWGPMPTTAVVQSTKALANAGKYYIISTGGADGMFTCSNTAKFVSFVDKYYSKYMIGIDFDIESGQTSAIIANILAGAKAAAAKYPQLRFSFTVATLGINQNGLNSLGTLTVNAVKKSGLKNYYINLLAMDYGSASVYTCIAVNGICNMGSSAVAAAKSLNKVYSIPYSRIELTAMIGGNDSPDETFTLADVQTVSSFVLSNGLAGIHFWSFDRDNDSPPGPASPTGNTYGKAGPLGFTNAFRKAIGTLTISSAPIIKRKQKSRKM